MNFMREWWTELTKPLAHDPNDTLPMLLDLLVRGGMLLMALATPAVVIIALLSAVGALPK